MCEEVGRALNNLDSALNELGMLASRTNAREEHLCEMYENILTINTRYVSNVSFGFRVRPMAPHIRYKPYKTPKERSRTKSENNDNETTTVVNKFVGKLDQDNVLDEISCLKRAKSLESIIAEGIQNIELSNINAIGRITELEAVSDSIQNLKVVE